MTPPRSVAVPPVLLPILLASGGGCGDDRAPTSYDHPVEPQCAPAEQRSCYDGPAGTEAVGSCAAGVQTCLDHGRGWGPCVGQQLPQPEICKNDGDESCDGFVSCGETVWSHRWGTDRDEVATDVAVDADGSLVITGYYRDPVDLGGGLLGGQGFRRKVLVAGLDPAGEHRYSFGLYGDQHLQPRAVATGPSGLVAFALDFQGTAEGLPGGPHTSAGDWDALVAVLETDGTVRWVRQLGDGGTDHVTDLGFDAAGDVVIVGRFTGSIDLGDGPVPSSGASDGLLAKLAGTDGSVRWSQLIGGAGDQAPAAVAVDPSGRIVVAGDFVAELVLGGSPLTAIGTERDVFVASFEGDGSPRFRRSFGDSQAQRCFDLAVDSAGEILITGQLRGRMDFGGGDLVAHSAGDIFVAKLGGDDGGHCWSRQLGGPFSQAGYGLAVDSRDGVVLSGYYEGEASVDGTALPPGGIDEASILLVKLDAVGGTVWSRGIRVVGNQSPPAVPNGWRRVAVDSEDRILLAGFAEGPLDLGDGASEPLGGADILVAKLQP
jgi:hypothetical protein